MMAMVVNSTAVVISGDTVRRANVIANRIGNDAIGVIKAQMIDLLKSKDGIYVLNAANIANNIPVILNPLGANTLSIHKNDKSAPGVGVIL